MPHELLAKKLQLSQFQKQIKEKPVLIRSLKLSIVGSEYYLDGGQFSNN